MRKRKIIQNVIENKRVVSGPDYRDLGAILLFIFLLPYIVSFFFGQAGKGDAEAGGKTEEGKEQIALQQGSHPAEAELFQEDWEQAEFLVCNRTAAGTELMPLETYLVSRLPATIDMGYETEALKAQAVVLRTELMRIYYDSKKAGKEARTKSGIPCIYVEERLASVDEAGYEKCKEAVSATKGMYMAYEGRPVKAPFFSVSAGSTRNGSEALGTDGYGYLKAVACNRDFTAADYAHTIRMSKNAFLEKLQELYPQLAYEEGQAVGSLLQVSRDNSGYATRIGAGGGYITGESFREAFALPSACFELEERKGEVWIKTKGVGHGLGFGQYAANEAARKGSDFIDILNYFFSGVVIEKTE